MRSNTASAETTLEKIKRTGVMTSANTFSYPPFGFIENGEKVGFDVDIANEIALRMSVKLVYEQIDFRGIIAALTSKRVDLLITGMVYTPDRAKQIAYSEPYFNGGVAAAYRSEKPLNQPDDLVAAPEPDSFGRGHRDIARDRDRRGRAPVSVVRRRQRRHLHADRRCDGCGLHDAGDDDHHELLGSSV